MGDSYLSQQVEGMGDDMIEILVSDTLSPWTKWEKGFISNLVDNDLNPVSYSSLSSKQQNIVNDLYASWDNYYSYRKEMRES